MIFNNTNRYKGGGMNCDYVRNYYNIPAEIGRLVKYKNRTGIIANDGGNYIAVNFDDMKLGQTLNVHPTDPNLEYLGMGEVRKMTRSQRRYREFIQIDCGCSFAEWLGIS